MIDHPSQDQLILYAADQLDAAEATEVRAHLQRGCPLCSGSLAEAEAMLGMLAGAVTPISPPKGLFSRIESAIDRRTAPRHEWTKRLMIGVTSGLVAASIAFAITWFAGEPSRQMLRSNDLRLVSLDGSPAEAKAKGRVLWDQEHHRWQVTVFDLAPPAAGKTYELWFITTDQRKLRAATFDTDPEGAANLIVSVPPDIGPLAMAAITDEPVGGSAQPTGSIRLAGKIPS